MVSILCLQLLDLHSSLLLRTPFAPSDYSTDIVMQMAGEAIIEDEVFEAESVTVRPKPGMVPR